MCNPVFIVLAPPFFDYDRSQTLGKKRVRENEPDCMDAYQKKLKPDEEGEAPFLLILYLSYLPSFHLLLSLKSYTIEGGQLKRD